MADLERHAARIAELVRQFESCEDPQTREQVFELLEHVDHLHRTCVWRLFELATELGGKGLVDRMTADPAVKTLFALYDLIPTEPLHPVSADAPVAAPYAGGFAPLGLGRLRGPRPEWQVAFAGADLPPGTLHGVEVDGVPVLLCSLAEGVFAYRNGCGGTALPLHLGTVAGGEIHCPWHGCRYDARTGRRLAGPGAGDLQPLPVAADAGTIRVAVRERD
jgi:nitrite reductase/ring-hydroxylating ferredoxin subunit